MIDHAIRGMIVHTVGRSTGRLVWHGLRTRSWDLRLRHYPVGAPSQTSLTRSEAPIAVEAQFNSVAPRPAPDAKPERDRVLVLRAFAARLSDGGPTMP